LSADQVGHTRTKPIARKTPTRGPSIQGNREGEVGFSNRWQQAERLKTAASGSDLYLNIEYG
jgi:hypothetical protein